MKTIEINCGLDIPISGEPDKLITSLPNIKHVALVGDDYVGMKPTMQVKAGDNVQAGQALFTDKKNPGVIFTAPGSGEIVAVNRGEKRKFESLVIKLSGNDKITFDVKGESSNIRDTLIQSGLWTSFRTRPYGKTPEVESSPASLFITASETTPLAPPPSIIIEQYKKEFETGLTTLTKLIEAPIHLCKNAGDEIPCDVANINEWEFTGPHPAGLASTHIHMIDPVNESHMVWQISYQDVIAIGHLFTTGELLTEKIIAFSGASVKTPTLIKVPVGADITEICEGKLTEEPSRVLSGSVLDGRQTTDHKNYLGKFHNQISVLPDNSGRSLFNWLMPGGDKFSKTPVFLGAVRKGVRFVMPTATWGGSRAIFPLGNYEQVMPLDIIATSLLKAISVGDTEKSKDLGALELIEEDLALCSYVCAGKNNFGPMLREILTKIELEG